MIWPWRDRKELSEEALEMHRLAELYVNEYHHARMQSVETALITRIEEIEGRVPSNEEVVRHGKHLIWPDGHEEYWWKRTLIAACESGRAEAFTEKLEPRFRVDP